MNFQITVVRCSACNKELSNLDRDCCARCGTFECSECRYRRLTDTYTIAKHNESIKFARNKHSN